MSKAKVSKKEVREIALTAYMKEFFTGMIALLMEDKSQKELTYVKTPITMPNGGNYLISILHIDGPKLDLETLRIVTDSQKEANNNKKME